MQNIDEDTKCPECGAEMMAEWENNGFSPPDPTHWEITGMTCPECGHEE